MIDDVYSGGTAAEAAESGYLLLSSAMAVGFLHPNCRDIFTTYFPGISEPPDSKWSKAELKKVKRENGRHEKAVHARDEAEKWERVKKYSLDGENRKKAEEKEREWREAAGENAGVAKDVKDVIMKPGVKNMLESDKYIMPEAKIKEYLLKPGAKHAEKFFDAGYTVGDIERLNRDMEELYDESKAADIRRYADGREKFSIFMELGVGKKKHFRTVWQKDTSTSKLRFITAHREE